MEFDIKSKTMIWIVQPVFNIRGAIISEPGWKLESLN